MQAPIPTPLAIASSDIEGLARQCVERALAARQSVTELTADEVSAVSGGALLISGGFPWGVLPFYKMSSILTIPTSGLSVPDAGGMARF